MEAVSHIQPVAAAVIHEEVEVYHLDMPRGVVDQVHHSSASPILPSRKIIRQASTRGCGEGREQDQGVNERDGMSWNGP